MDWLAPSLVFMGLSSAVVSVSFFYVRAKLLPRRYVLVWALAWLFALPHLWFVWRLQGPERGHLDWTLHQAFLVLNTLLVASGCYEFVHRRLPARALVAVGVPGLAWAALAPFLFDNFFDLSFPGSLLFGLSYLWTASRFERLRRERGTNGARVLAVLFALAGLHELDYPLVGNLVWAAPVGFGLAAVFHLAIGIGLLVMVLEESRADALRERARAAAILENLPVGVLVTDVDGRIQLANGLARRIVPDAPEGRAPRMEEVERTAFRASDGAPIRAGEEPISGSLARGEVLPARELLLAADGGAPRPILVNAGPVRDGRGECLGGVAVFQDIAEVKRLQEEISRSQKLQGLGTLAAGVAHDFNNALTMILGHAELALAENPGPAVRDQLEVVVQVASDGAAVVRRLQDVARTRAARASDVCDLATIVRETIEITRPRWRDEAHSRAVEYEIHTRLAEDALVAGNPAELREALLNLTFNALDAMPRGGRLSFSVARAGGEVVVAVADTGSGMTPEVRERIFDPFFTTKGQRGTGLGLPLVFSIVQRHGGQLGVDSSPGAGSTFTLRFPAADRAAAAAARTAARAPEPSARLRLLVVDDEALVRGLTASLLRSSGHEVDAAEGGVEALELIARRDYDVVLTDLGMPGMNGWDLAGLIRQRVPTTRIVLVTGWGETISPERARQAGVARVLSKPFTRAQLLECIAAAAQPSSPAAA